MAGLTDRCQEAAYRFLFLHFKVRGFRWVRVTIQFRKWRKEEEEKQSSLKMITVLYKFEQAILKQNRAKLANNAR